MIKSKRKKRKVLKGKAKRKAKKRIVLENRAARADGFKGTLD